MNSNVNKPDIVNEEKNECCLKTDDNDRVLAIKEETHYNEILIKLEEETEHYSSEDECAYKQHQQILNDTPYSQDSAIKQEKYHNIEVEVKVKIENDPSEDEFIDKKHKKIKKQKLCKKDKKCALKKNKSNISMEQEDTNLKCGLCDFTSTCSLELNQHLVRHCQENILNCQLCNFEGKDVAHMVSHRYEHCPESDKRRYKCPMCSEQFQADYRLQYHYRTVHLKTKGGLCIICGKTFLDLGRWRVHEREHVTINYTCDHCGKGFLQRYKMIEHLDIHYNIFKFTCSICGKGFRKAGNLKCHIIACHREEDPATCTICNRTYKNNSMLKRHMYEEHAQRKHICQTCSKGFCTKRSLEKHIYNYHTAIKPYACELCDARYRASWSLKSHLRTHTGELPYTCQECGKGFNNSSTLKRHQSVHTGVRPVKCLHCDSTFHTKTKMLKHYNSKHKDVPVVKNSEIVIADCVFVKEERE